MCEPTTIMLGVSTAAAMAGAVAQARAQAQAQQQAHQAQMSAYNQQLALNQNQRTHLGTEYGYDDAALQVQQQQADQAASGDMSERARQAMMERGKLIAAASSNGTGGSAAARMGNTINYEEGTDLATMENNRASHVQQIQNQRRASARGVNYQGSTIIDPNKPNAPSGVDKTALGIQLIGIGANAGATYYNYKRPTSTPPSNKAG